MRVSYENNMIYFMHEMGIRTSFYYMTPMYSSSKSDRRLDNLLMEFQEKISIDSIKDKYLNDYN